MIPSVRHQRRLARAGFTMMEVVATLVLLGVTKLPKRSYPKKPRFSRNPRYGSLRPQADVGSR